MFRLKTTFIISFMLICASVSVWSQKTNTRYQSYIDRYSRLAVEQMYKWRIPASISLAQGLLESGAGESELARKGNNHFGIKCHGWTGATTHHDDDLSQECFRAYPSVDDSYEDHSQFLARQPRYSRLFSLDIYDYKGWAHGLKACGYATSPTYAQKLINIIELYDLQRFDHASPSTTSSATILSSTTYENSATHRVYFRNKSYYILARQGDTFKTIGKEFSINPRRLAAYNEMSMKAVITAGAIICLQKKRKRADKIYKRHLHEVSAGESLYSISQFYGITLKSLCKKNKLSPQNCSIKVGDKLKVY